MGHSTHFNLVKRYYILGVWNAARVRNAVVMEWITQAEFTEITGLEY